MIDSVNNQNRGYYEYNKINAKTGAEMGRHEKFALGYDSSDKESAKKDDKKSVKEMDGVVVEFSEQSKAKQGGFENQHKGASGAEDALDMEQTLQSAKGFIGHLIQAVTDFWKGIKQTLFEFWNSDSSVETVQEAEEEIEERADIIDTTGEEIEGESDGASAAVQEAEAVREWEDVPSAAGVAKLPPSLDVDETVRKAEELFANGHYVKNSDLLTYYDRSGKIVKLSGTDKNRILQGDSRGGRLI